MEREYNGDAIVKNNNGSLFVTIGKDARKLLAVSEGDKLHVKFTKTE